MPEPPYRKQGLAREMGHTQKCPAWRTLNPGDGELPRVCLPRSLCSWVRGVEPAHLVFRMEAGRTALEADGKPRR